ncbi:3-dehydroshikimate dehydratase [Saccharata proteae CBS 121410]|uniref:3-dehydroshikimate dehydratase n=1 Tax=Saccharata proteae CBS 121410 TaxID=1314787 RepID=A0A9P4HQU8_9PEZI|nr:3-dehydroshikimate dehydratase [Saccharata proteae CBS 121410]
MPCRPAISSMSLGRAWLHKLPHKLDMAQKYGLTGIELFHEDLEYVAEEMGSGGATAENQLKAAELIRQLCDERGLTIIALQPFMHYEGLEDRKEHAARIEKLKLWFRLAKILGTNTIQIPSNFLPASQITDDKATIVKDMIEVADLGAQEDPPFNFAYESLAWGTHIDTWEQSWEIVEKVNRPNFGACLDTYNIAGRVYADPTSPTGKTPNADADIRASIDRLVKTVDAKKVFYVQVVDGERLEKPLLEGHEFHVASQPARMNWSRNCRLFYGEQHLGGYLPVKEITRAFIEGIGFEGWVSMELFNRVMADPDPETPEKLARRAGEAWRKMVVDFKLEDDSGSCISIQSHVDPS